MSTQKKADVFPTFQALFDDIFTDTHINYDLYSKELFIKFSLQNYVFSIKHN